jgi:hypothetical protein
MLAEGSPNKRGFTMVPVRLLKEEPYTADENKRPFDYVRRGGLRSGCLLFVNVHQLRNGWSRFIA